jgi:hypothetical protein
MSRLGNEMVFLKSSARGLIGSVLTYVLLSTFPPLNMEPNSDHGKQIVVPMA